MDFDVNLDEFERQWISLAEEIVKLVFANEQIQQLKQNLRTNGFLSLEDKSLFIVIADKIKSDLIRDRYGEEASPTYQVFLRQWEHWQEERGRKRDKPANLFEENINHFLYGSTPDPEEFLREFDVSQVH